MFWLAPATGRRSCRPMPRSGSKNLIGSGTRLWQQRSVGIAWKSTPRVRPSRGTGEAVRREAIPLGTLRNREPEQSPVSLGAYFVDSLRVVDLDAASIRQSKGLPGSTAGSVGAGHPFPVPAGPGPEHQCAGLLRRQALGGVLPQCHRPAGTATGGGLRAGQQFALQTVGARCLA